MRLNCTIERRNRQLAPLALPGKRAAASILSIGKKSGSGDVCIHNYSITTKENTSYKVKGNINKVFTKFIEEGKTTLSFIAPPHDLMIKTDDKIQLKSFLNCLRLVLQGRELSKGAGGLSSLDSDVKVHKPKTKLIVTNSANYPVLEGFPRTLVQLHIVGIDHKNFDSRILKLNQLRILNLSNNSLKTIPCGLGDLPNLNEVNLARNDLGLGTGNRGAWDWLRGSYLPNTLQSLDLSYNSIPFLPSFLRDCRVLSNLRVEGNLLTVLPSGIGMMDSLRNLYAACNKLKFLPGSMCRKKIDHLDLSHNPFTGECITTSINMCSALSLKELAARSVIFYKIPVNESIVPYTVLRFMQGCDFCFCGRAFFNPVCSRMIIEDIKNLAGDVVLGPGESSVKPIRMSMCSNRCKQSQYFRYTAFLP